MQPHHDPQSPEARWVPLADAARAWGKSENTLRNWVRQGRIIGEQIQRDPDNPRDNRPVWRILIRDQPQTSADDSESDQPQSILSDPQPAAPDARDAIMLAQMDALADMHERLLDAYQQIVEARERAATAEANATHAQASADRAEARADDLAAQLADRTNLSHAEASKIFEEAREMRAERDVLARQLAESQAAIARERAVSEGVAAERDRERQRADDLAARPWWQRRWW